ITVVTGARVCADGGAGGQGGSVVAFGGQGGESPCDGQAGAPPTHTLNAGGDGTAGAFGTTPPINAVNEPTADVGGGGGGGGTGWIRLHAISGAPTVQGTVTPPPKIN